GHSFHKESARQSALRALYITGAGGLSLLLGILLIKTEAGTLSLGVLYRSSYQISTLPLILITIGALTKSAQLPWHFWLPGAMEAPTPISAFLHSATMVKAGLFLIGVIAPLALHHAWWPIALTWFGGLTALWASLLALFQSD